jgi:acetolactate synthase-1/2/3 large subunit
MPDAYIYVSDVGQNQLWSAGNVDIRQGGRFLTTGGMGTMGYSISAALGARLASVSQKKKGRFTLAVCGDGSFQMNMMELATLCQENADIKIVVFVNGKLGLVREMQTSLYNDNQCGVDLTGNPDPVAIAKAYGVNGSWLRQNEDESTAIKTLLNHKGPYVLAVEVHQQECAL